MRYRNFATAASPRGARNRLEHVPQERTAALLAKLMDADFAPAYFTEAGATAHCPIDDGLRFELTSGDGSFITAPPAMRRSCGVTPEAATAERADALLAWGSKAAREVVR